MPDSGVINLRAAVVDCGDVRCVAVRGKEQKEVASAPQPLFGNRMGLGWEGYHVMTI